MSVCSSNKSDCFSFASVSSSHLSQITRDIGESSSEQWHDFESKCSSQLRNSTFNIIVDEEGLIAGSEPDLRSQPPKSVRRACNKYSKYLTTGNQIEKSQTAESSHIPSINSEQKEKNIKVEQDKQDKADENIDGKAKLELEKQFQMSLDQLNNHTSATTAALAALMQDYKHKFAEENQLLHKIIDQKDEKIHQLMQNESCLLKQLQAMSNQLEQIKLLAEKKAEFRQ